MRQPNPASREKNISNVIAFPTNLCAMTLPGADSLLFGKSQDSIRRITIEITFF